MFIAKIENIEIRNFVAVAVTITDGCEWLTGNLGPSEKFPLLVFFLLAFQSQKGEEMERSSPSFLSLSLSALLQRSHFLSGRAHPKVSGGGTLNKRLFCACAYINISSAVARWPASIITAEHTRAAHTSSLSDERERERERLCKKEKEEEKEEVKSLWAQNQYITLFFQTRTQIKTHNLSCVQLF